MKQETLEALTKCLKDGYLTIDQYLELTVKPSTDPISTFLVGVDPVEKLKKLKVLIDAL